jgi:glucokinase
LFREAREQILVFDVGGSHIGCGLFDLASMSVDRVSTIPVSSGGSPAQFLSAFESLAECALANSHACTGVAIAMPNPFDYDRGISRMRHKHQLLYGVELRPELARRLQVEPTSIDFLNDASAFLTGETYEGAAQGAGRVIGITLGTGVGSAFAVGGKIVCSGRGVPPGGEIWNLPYRDSIRNSIVEDFISTRAIQQIYERSIGIRDAPVCDIARRAVHEPQARLAFICFGSELGKVLRHVSMEFRPERIVLGGGISRAAALFLPAAERELAEVAIPLKISELFDRAPLVGAGVAWMNKHMPGRIPPESGRA